MDICYIFTYIGCCLAKDDMDGEAIKPNSFLWIKHYDAETNEFIQ